MEYRSRKMLELIERKFRGKRYIPSRYVMRFPSSAEREYTRLMNDYLNTLGKVVEKHMPRIKKLLADKDSPTSSIEQATNMVIEDITKVNEKVLPKMNLTKRVEGIGIMTKSTAIDEFRKSVKDALGVDIRKDYYMGDFYQKEMEVWVGENTDLIKTISHDMLNDMRADVSEGYIEGLRSEEIAERIQHDYNVTQAKAKMLARDQVAKLNGKITRAQQEDAGVTEYIWRTVGDERVRPGHDRLNGKKFKWDDPPEIYEWASKKDGGGWKDTGRRCNPMEDYNCRCIALPVFDAETINLPVESEDDDI